VVVVVFVVVGGYGSVIRRCLLIKSKSFASILANKGTIFVHACILLFYLLYFMIFVLFKFHFIIDIISISSVVVVVVVDIV